MTRFLVFWIGVMVAGFLARGAQERIIGPEGGEFGAKTPRAVLLVDEPDLEALLIAGLSGVETLARADLPTAVNEQALTGGDLRLVNAEVVLVVTRTERGGMARVVDCVSGATVVALDLPVLPVEEAANWIVSRVRPFMGALADPTRPRVSLTGLRFVTDSVENRATERSINLMLATRLQSGGALVLERWRMTDLVFERTLGAVDSPFWRAAEVVDGSLSARANQLSARVRIRYASGDERLIQAAGDTAAKLVDDIARQVLAGSPRAAVVSGGSVEADAFLVEARWMLAHGLQREAWQAAESALALGTSGKREAEMLRVRAATMCVFPGNLHGYASGNRSGSNISSESQLPVRVGLITEAVLLAGDHWNDYFADAEFGWGPDYPPVLAYETIFSALEILRVAQDQGWSDRNPGAVWGLRAAIRRLVTLMETGLQGVQRQYYFSILTDYAGYWHETSAEAVAFYRRMLDPRFDAGTSTWAEMVRARLSKTTTPYAPYLGGVDTQAHPWRKGSVWRVPAGDRHALQTWEAFINELDESPDTLSRADGLILRWHSTADNAGRAALADRIVDFLAANTNALAGPRGGAIASYLRAPLSDGCRRGSSNPTRDKAVGLFLTLLESDSSLSPTLVKLTKCLFPVGAVGNDDEELGREMLRVLNARLGRKTISRQERVSVEGVCVFIGERLPSLRSPSEPKEEDALVVRSLWIAGEHAPAEELSRSLRLQASSTVWHDSRLWMLQVGSKSMWQVDPASGATNIIAAANQPMAAVGSQLVVWGRRFVMTTGSGVWVLREDLRSWEPLDLPVGSYLIGVVRGELWAGAGMLDWLGAGGNGAGTTIYQVSPELSCELVVSSRRRPALHPLDERLKGKPFVLLPSGRGGLLIGTRGPGEIFAFSDTASDEPFKVISRRYVGPLSVTGAPGLLMRRRYPYGDRIGTTNLQLIDTERDELVLSHPRLSNADEVRFAYPKEGINLTATNYAATWRGDGIDVLVWASSGAPHGAERAWLMRVGVGEERVRPLRFEWSDEVKRRVLAAGGSADDFRHPYIQTGDLLFTDQGLVVMGDRMSGFWFIPNDDLRASGFGF